MVDVVNTVNVQESAPRYVSKVSSADASAQAENNAPLRKDQIYVSSSIRVDNLQNVAILEYRSSETGEIKEQYPTQKQIEAFKSAQRLQEVRRETTSAEVKKANVKHVDVSIGGGHEVSSAPKVKAPAPKAPTPTPTVAAHVPTTSAPAESGESSGSVLV